MTCVCKITRLTISQLRFHLTHKQADSKTAFFTIESELGNNKKTYCSKINRNPWLYQMYWPTIFELKLSLLPHPNPAAYNNHAEYIILLCSTALLYITFTHKLLMFCCFAVHNLAEIQEIQCKHSSLQENENYEKLYATHRPGLIVCSEQQRKFSVYEVMLLQNSRQVSYHH